MKIEENYRNGPVMYAERFGDEIACFIFDHHQLGVPFQTMGLVGRIPCIKHYAPRTQKDTIHLVCRQLCREHNGDYWLLKRASRNYFVVPTD